MGVGVVPEVVRRTHPGLCWLWGVCLRVCVWVGACCRVLGRCALVVVLRVGAGPPCFCSGVGLARVGGLVVICIVDASIFVLCVVIVVVFVWVVLCVCFFGRSVDALASGADEGRGGLR